MPMTMMLTKDAERILRAKITRRYGYGAYISCLIVAEQAREELRRELAQQATRPVNRQSWAETGLRVD